MTSKAAKALPVIYAAAALKELDEIWDWNEKTYSRDHAAKYISFLEQHIDSLGTRHQKGRVVNNSPKLRYIQIRLRNRGHGHVAVYTADDHAVNILHIFHTAQDWQTKLSGEKLSE